MPFKISIKTPADINREIVASNPQSSINNHLSDDVITEEKSSVCSPDVPALKNNISRILSQLQPTTNSDQSSKAPKNNIVINPPIKQSYSTTPTCHLDGFTSHIMLDTFPQLSSSTISKSVVAIGEKPTPNNNSLDSCNFGEVVTHEPLPFVPKLIPPHILYSQSLVDTQEKPKNVIKTGSTLAFKQLGIDTPKPGALVLEDIVLPSGWRRVVKERQSGRSAGSADVYLHSPKGKRLRSRAELARYLEKTGDTSVTLDAFSFSRSKRKNVVANNLIVAQLNENTVPSKQQIRVTEGTNDLVNKSGSKEMTKELSDDSSSNNDEDVENLLSQKMNAVQGSQVQDLQREEMNPTASMQNNLHNPQREYLESNKRKRDYEIDLSEFLEVQLEQ